MKKHTLAVWVFVMMSTACSARAEDLQWNEQWPRFRAIGYALTGASVAAALSVTIFIPYPDDAHWESGILFDDTVRTAIRVRDPDHRDFVRRASDVSLGLSIVQVGLIDSLIVPLARGSSDVAAQLTLMNVQAFSLNTLFATLLFKVVARERPLVRDCRDKPGYTDPLCDSGEFASFPSSHTSTAFTAAGLACVHHEFLPLYGGAWDGVACAGSLALASATGLFRIVGDRHYMTDVLFGAAAGFSLGYIYPWLFHYNYAPVRASSSHAVRWSLVPGGSAEAPYGVSLAGYF